MKAKELAEELLRNPDFEVIFRTSTVDDKGFNLHDIKNVGICDIGYSDEIIILGEEDNGKI